MAKVRNMAVASSMSAFLLMCLCGAVLAQTFQYSRGWTNGKKRANSAALSRLFPETESPETLGICQMFRLQEIIGRQRRDQIVLPCEIIGENDSEPAGRFRRKATDNDSMDSMQNSPPCIGDTLSKCRQIPVPI